MSEHADQFEREEDLEEPSDDLLEEQDGTASDEDEDEDEGERDELIAED